MTQSDKLPPCGLYKTRKSVAGVPADKLVYFHNHGEPGPGIYLPTGWHSNRAEFDEHGHTFTKPAQEVDALEPLLAEGLYRVTQSFHCCDERCTEFEPELLVQLGYDGSANILLFEPCWVQGNLEFPEEGTRIDAAKTANLAALKVYDEDDNGDDDSDETGELPSDPKLLH